MTSRIHTLTGLAAIAAAAMISAGSAVAGGSLKDGPMPEPQRRCTLSANVAIASDYVFRGFSQTAEGPAIQGGFDAACGMFYAGVWASNLDWGGSPAGDVANIEMDWYAGIKPTTGRISWDLGVIYYTYPKSQDFFAGRDNNYVELKVGASTEAWKGGTVGATLFYSPEYQYETGNVWTLEGNFAQVLPKMGMFTPTFSALVGYQRGTDNDYLTFGPAGGDDHYTYWNAGVTFAFLEKWSFDVRYWDTNLPSGVCNGAIFQCDSRVMATLKFTY
jgi:uncharacterized protein (TIGR02001 family)